MQKALILAALIAVGLPGIAAAAPDEQDAVAQGSRLIIQSDMVIGAPGPCALQSRFSPGDRIVIRAKVVDGITGNVVPDASAIVRLSDGTIIPMLYGPHPPPQLGIAQDNYWTAVYAIRPDAALGTMSYTVEATEGNRIGTFEPFSTESSQIIIVPRT